MLSNKAVNILASSIAEGIVDDILASDEFINMLHETVPDLVTARLGECEGDLLFDLSLAVMDRITIKACKV